MSEVEWLVCNYPMPMLEFLQGKTSARKLRLFASSCCLQQPVWRLLNNEARALVSVAGRFAEDSVAWEEVLTAANLAPRGRVMGGPWRSRNPVHLPPSSQAERAALGLAVENAWEAAWAVIREGTNLLGSAPGDLLREIVGNPFRPVAVDSAWLAWENGTVVKLAEAIYEQGAFERLPVLADALEDAGCPDADLLAHCRGPGPHVRGCWLVDLLLGKG
jgi:hypothetical protein